MRISDWSSDVCSSDLAFGRGELVDRALHVDQRFQLRDAVEMSVDNAAPCRGVVVEPLAHVGIIPALGGSRVVGGDGVGASFVPLFGGLGVNRFRSEERRVGTECGSRCGLQWWDK